ncbi:unnamed protein product [Calicophoron daubneyi]|uniref:E3 ubiquitin-protein ligase SHPRH n=1 Tax=Calicophoron daubneyi TaxID=300641 RepID=A0AAV2T3K8_CALDB
MRSKHPPRFLTCNRRRSMSFYFHLKQNTEADTHTSDYKSKPKRHRVIGTEQKELLNNYPHSITLLSDHAPEDYLLQTISFPLDSTLLRASGTHNKMTLYFNSSAFLLLSCDENTVKEYEVSNAGEVTPLFFAASSSLLDVYYRVSDSCLHLDVCLKARSVSSDDFPQRPLARQQYQKIHDFITFQTLGRTDVFDTLNLFLFERHSETQQEFVTLIKLIYDCVQAYHEKSRCLWHYPEKVTQPEQINTVLRPYQLDAVEWMLYRESTEVTVDEKELYNLMFIPVQLSKSQQNVYFSIYSGTFMDHLPTLVAPCLGGILSDEMGLGKTLEVITLILLRPWSDWSRFGGRVLDMDGNVVHDGSSNMVQTLATVTPDDQSSILCSCGGVDETDGLDSCRCTRCYGPRQHAACVQYTPSEYTDLLPIKHEYICPQCWSHLRIESKATLIVAPDHIWQQWKEEIQTHVAQHSMRVLIYAGMEAPVTSIELGVHVPIRARCHINPYAPRTRVTATATNSEEEETLLPGFVQPGQLACADIVLTSYSVIQRELDWAEVVAERQAGTGGRPNLRLAQRYLCRPSPLTCVRWWRICLDEAQMVERVTSKTARMLFQMDAVHRWCVTGTPAEKSIDDLFGLFAYLQFVPFDTPHYWHSLLYQPFLAATAPSWAVANEGSNSSTLPKSDMETVRSTRLVAMLSHVLWRNTKALVGDQLILPPITEQIHWIDFTSVERYIHDRVLAQSAGALQRLLRTMSISTNQSLASLPGAAHWRLVYLITRLRQACTHASMVVASGGPQKHIGRRGRNERGRRLTDDDFGCGDLNDVGNDDIGGGYTASSSRDGHSLSLSGKNRTTRTGCYTMTEVIRRVVDETRRECEGLLRTWVFNKNGAAGCFIIKQQFVQAADCYREVLQAANDLEHRHGVLADWSQRLHAITNLHWLIQSRQVPLSDEPAPSATPTESTTLKGQSASVISVPETQPDNSDMKDLDPRVDRDLLAKAERLRTSYIKMHSHLLGRVHESLEPVAMELDEEFKENDVDLLNEDEVESIGNLPYGASWLSWLSDAMDLLYTCGIGPNLIEMLVASFQGKPGSYRGNYRTNLLYAGSINGFKAMLLSEVSDVFQARKQLREAVKPLVKTWKSFLAGREADPAILQPFYACCARANESEDQNKSEKDDGDRMNKFQKKSKATREIDELQSGSKLFRPKVKKTRCAYCVAARALRDYQCAVNHERLKGGRRALSDRIDESDNIDSTDETGTGLSLGNPLVVALSIICHQVLRLLQTSRPEKLQFSASEWRRRARRLEQIFRQMGKEILLTSRMETLTKEWWNIHDDTEQFVVRLQATCPTDLAFIHTDEVDAQLQEYIVQYTVMWPRLQSRLGHFNFLRNAHLAAVTGANVKQESDGNNSVQSSGSFKLECPTCLQPHSPSNPTFALLPGCWHTLCLPCHDRIASMGQVCQRRCPICRTPFTSNETAGVNARRRRPLTLIHYSGERSKTVDDAIKKEGDVAADEPEYTVVGDHSSKVQAVIRCLKQIKQEDADAKAIVFSSWLSVLVTLTGALEQNGLSYTTLFQARDACCPGRLAGFQCMGSATWILLMPIQLGANGLNLTSANHLLLVDPVLSHGREAQAIARMHRIGQTRPSVVHRFLVRDSIEATLHEAHVRSQMASRNPDDPDTIVSNPASSTGRMIGAGTRRTSSTVSGVAGPDDDRGHLMQMTIGQLAELLHLEANSAMLEDELALQSTFVTD